MKFFTIVSTLVFGVVLRGFWWLAQQFGPRFELLMEGGLITAVGAVGVLFLWPHVRLDGVSLGFLAAGMFWYLAFPLVKIVAASTAAPLHDIMPWWSESIAQWGIITLTVFLCVVVFRGQRSEMGIR